MRTADDKANLARTVLALLSARKAQPRAGADHVMILVPVKNLSGAKQRLASLLDQTTRTELAQAMLLDVMETLAAWVGRPRSCAGHQRPVRLRFGPAL